MTFKEKEALCKKYFNELRDILSDTHEVTANRCKVKRPDMYLCPKGTRKEITYHGKPHYSFRYSTKWNFYSPRCEGVVQCYSKDFPHAHTDSKGAGPDGAVLAFSVCYYGNDNLYHVVYGEKYNRETGEWEWIESDPAFDALGVVA